MARRNRRQFIDPIARRLVAGGGVMLALFTVPEAFLLGAALLGSGGWIAWFHVTLLALAMFGIVGAVTCRRLAIWFEDRPALVDDARSGIPRRPTDPLRQLRVTGYGTPRQRASAAATALRGSDTPTLPQP